MLFRKVHIGNKGGVFLRLFGREGGKKEESKIKHSCDLCDFKAKTKPGLVLHKLRRHNQ